MSDIEKSFNFLNDNIPQWFKDITDMEEKVASMQDEISRVPVSKSPAMKKKTGSMESIRDLDAIAEETCTSAAPIQIQDTSRKRKSRSVLSGRASGPSKFRTRTMVIVHYDGQIQKSFEKMVRAIGTGRNLLRKGKMAAKMDALADLAGACDDDDDDEDDDDNVMSKIGYRHRAGLSALRSRAGTRTHGPGSTGANSSTPTELFDTTDKALEQAQSLCEKAAHQSLRDGDCRKELNGIRKYFEEVLESAKKEVAKYAARQKEEAQQAAIGKESQIESAKLTPEPEPKVMLPSVRPSMGIVPTNSKMLEIEVDENEDSDDMDFQMPPIRLTSRA